MELISRDDAIKCLDGRGLIMATTPKVAVRKYSAMVRTRIEVLPTIEERKEGEWIFKTVFPNDKSEFPIGYLVCSVCGSHHSNSIPCNYCDNCGARMKGE